MSLDIGRGNSTFLVRDKRFKDINDPFFKWLKLEGFNDWGQHGHYGDKGVDWIYINILTKVYACGMPGIPITQVVGDHAITMEEFFTIYNIFSNYKGMSILQMSLNEGKNKGEYKK